MIRTAVFRASGIAFGFSGKITTPDTLQLYSGQARYALSENTQYAILGTRY